MSDERVDRQDRAQQTGDIANEAVPLRLQTVAEAPGIIAAL
jgi:hypothetical protein